MLKIYIDADACPVREETYKVGIRHGVPVCVVSNSFLRVLPHKLISRVIVSDGFDAADDYIAERAGTHTVVITSDILLAQRCVHMGAKVLAPNGKAFTENNIGTAVATRAIMEDLRAGALGESGSGNFGGPPPFSPADRSRFLQELHTTVERMKRGTG